MPGLAKYFFSGLFRLDHHAADERRLRSSGVPLTPEIVSSFSDYEKASVQRIAMAHKNLNSDSDDDVIRANAAFFLPADTAKSARALLIVHGLTDSPYYTRDLAQYFQTQGFSVLSIVLPGHGTCPGDLLTVTKDDWITAVGDAIDLALDNYDDVYFCGCSIGAALGLYHSLSGKRIKGLFLFSPALKLTKAAASVCILRLLSRIQPAFKWLSILPDTDLYKYETLAMNAICESRKLLIDLGRLLDKHSINIPLFLTASEDDATVVGNAALSLFESAGAARQMLYYSRYAAAVPAGVEVIRSDLSERGICSAAHTSAIVSPDHPYYGKQGSYASCGHLYPYDRRKYQQCKAFREDCLGEVNLPEMKDKTVRRLTYNPWFDELLSKLDKYIKNIL